MGKSLLIRCLIKHYTRQGLGEVRGPITVVSGKQRRLTFVECPQVGGYILYEFTACRVSCFRRCTGLRTSQARLNPLTAQHISDVRIACMPAACLPSATGPHAMYIPYVPPLQVFIQDAQWQ